MKIYVARHGQDKDNADGILNGHRDTELTPLGEEQAQDLTRAIKEAGLTFDAIYCSPLKRAMKTGGIVYLSMEPKKRCPIFTHSLLIERDFGVMTGKQVDQISALCGPDIIKTDTITYFLNVEGAETYERLLCRAEVFLLLLQDMHEINESILIFTHGDMGKMLFAAYYGIPWREVLTMFHFGNSELLLLSEDCKPEDAFVFKTAQYNH